MMCVSVLLSYCIFKTPLRVNPVSMTSKCHENRHEHAFVLFLTTVRHPEAKPSYGFGIKHVPYRTTFEFGIVAVTEATTTTSKLLPSLPVI